VEKTGANVTKLKVDDAIYGYPTFGGGWADYVAVKEWEVGPKPKSLNFVEAAAVPMGALTAWQALVDVAKLQPGQTILVHGGSGGVGSFAVQIAKARGARVIATASTANQDVLKQLGADVAVDYTKTKFEDDADDLTEIAQLVDAGKIKPVVTEVLPLGDAVKAQQQAATHHTRGKVVLRIADEPKG
jgi:NADPH:quinone reductase-like Zn-dependent oxidoreductase